VTPKQERFVREYLVDLNAKCAAIRSGYSPRSAEQLGFKLLSKPEVKRAVEAGIKKSVEKAEITVDRVMEELGAVAFLSSKELFDAEGNLIPINKLPDHVAAAIHPTEVLKRNLEAGDGVTDTVHRVRVHDKMKALELLGKRLSMFTEKVEISGGLQITEALKKRFENAKR
jgi:phage terminase small subunit